MPEIGLKATLIFSIVVLIAGILIGTHTPLIVQALIVIGLIIFCSTKAVRFLELGAVPYIVISAVLCVGMAFGDLSFFFQKHTDIHISNPFKAS